MPSQTHSTDAVEDDRIIIENAEVTDPEVVNYLNDIDPNERGEAVDRALRMSVVMQANSVDEYAHR